MQIIIKLTYIILDVTAFFHKVPYPFYILLSST
jgi:hypothetical protein